MASPENVGISEVRQAVKKLLSLVYYDKSNTNLHLRKQIADYFFEFGREKLVDRVLRLVRGQLSIENVLTELSYQVIPKGVKSKDGDQGFVSNNRESKEYEITDVNLIIDAPLEIHVISVLWLLEFGYKIDAQLPETCYGNRLILNEDKTRVENGRALLKPYIRQYQKWRDEGIKIAKTQLDQDKDVAFVNLDISSYYYHVRLDWNSLEVEHDDKYTLENLDQILFRVHKKYTELVFEDFPQKCDVKEDDNTDKVILPLGLVSSYTLANKYLQTFDTEVEEKIRPLYYGRYVDDIIIVISRPKLTENLSKNKFIKLVERNGHLITSSFDKLSRGSKFIINNLSEILRVHESKDRTNYFFRSDPNRLLSVKNRKVLIYEFMAGQSQSVLEKLIKDIEERSSEFRFLPTDEDANFDTDAYELLYDDSHGKPRTLKDYKESKLGLATYLYRRSAVALWADSTELKDESDKILAFFSGSNLIDYFQYWERVATYLVIANRKSELKDFIQNAIDVIGNCKYQNNEVATTKLQETLRLYLSISIAQAFTLNPKIFCDEWFENRIVNFTGDRWYSSTEQTIVSLRWSWLVRNFLIPHPLLEFTKWARSKDISELPSLINKVFSWKEMDSNSFDLSSDNSPFPRFIRLYETSLYLWYKVIIEADDEGFDESFTTKFIEKTKKLFFDVNGIDPKKNKENLVELLKKEVPNTSKLNIQEVHIDQRIIEEDSEDQKSDTICIGLANMEVDWQYQASYSLRGRPVVNRARYTRISKILNQFLKTDPSAALAIFPEVSIPHDYVNLMTDFSKRHQKGLVYGTEHVNTGKVGYNFIITTLPTKLNKRNDALFIPRIKNHYSHEEKAQIRANNIQVGTNPTDYYHLFKWRNLYFTTFYCFELADIEHRSFFRSKIDLLAASEYNRDTNYFSNIVESTARDLNVIVAQANSSEFGDNRITIPAKTIFKDLLRVDGGDNDLVIVSKIDLKEFREHQEVGYEIQKDHKIYKPSPPNFDIEYVKKRIRGNWILEPREINNF